MISSEDLLILMNKQIIFFNEKIADLLNDIYPEQSWICDANMRKVIGDHANILKIAVANAMVDIHLKVYPGEKA